MAVPVALGLVRNRVPADFELASNQVDDPVIGNAGSGVQAPLAAAVVGERGIADLHEEQSGCGVILVIPRTAGNNSHVRLRFGTPSQMQRLLIPDAIARAES